MEKEFVPYELAVKLKALGFDEPCFATIDQTSYLHINGTKRGIRGAMWYDTIDCPTFSQAFRWFDENTGLSGFVVAGIKEEHFDWLIRIDWEEEIECEEYASSRLEAELACLTKLIKIVETRTK